MVVMFFFLRLINFNSGLIFKLKKKRPRMYILSSASLLFIILGKLRTLVNLRVVTHNMG